MNLNVTKDREKYIGGSDLPNILGYNMKYGKSAYNFARKKLNLIVDEFTGNEHTKYGQLMEPIIRDYINISKNLNFIEDTIINEEKGYRGNCDGIDRKNNLLLEVKTFKGNLDVDYYSPQCQYYMELFNIDTCLLVGYEKPDDFYKGIDYTLENSSDYFNTDFYEDRIVIHEIKRDKVFFSSLDKLLINYKLALSTMKENPNICEKDFYKILYGNNISNLFNRLEKMEIEMVNYKNLEKEYKETKIKIYDFFNNLKIKSHDTGLIRISRVDPITIKKKDIDIKALSKNHPNIYQKYLIDKETTKSGYLIITPIKEEKE